MKKLFVIGTTSFVIIAGIIIALGFSIQGGLDQSTTLEPIVVPVEEAVVPPVVPTQPTETTVVPDVETEDEAETENESSDESVVPTPTPTPTPTPVVTPKPVPVASLYTVATVAQHASASNCWSIVDGNVYDLTQWIPQHPGGQSTILPMCGVDGSSVFHGYHGSKQSPANALARYKLGKLGS